MFQVELLKYTEGTKSSVVSYGPVSIARWKDGIKSEKTLVLQTVELEDLVSNGCVSSINCFAFHLISNVHSKTLSTVLAFTIKIIYFSNSVNKNLGKIKNLVTSVSL